MKAASAPSTWYLRSSYVAKTGQFLSFGFCFLGLHVSRKKSSVGGKIPVTEVDRHMDMMHRSTADGPQNSLHLPFLLPFSQLSLLPHFFLLLVSQVPPWPRSPATVCVESLL